MDDDFDDLLGSTVEEEDELELSDVDDDLPFASAGRDYKRSMSEAGAERALKGAPPAWFARLLGIGRTTVQRKLADVDPKHVSAKGTKYYDPREALPYLVHPHDLKKHLALMNPRDLPERLRKDYWMARKAEQDVRERANDLWRSADVHKALAEIMKIVKDTITLWTDSVNEASGLSTEQVDILDNLSRRLLSDLHESVLQYTMNKITRSQEEEFGESDDEAA